MTILDAARKDLGVKESPSGGFDNKAFEVAMVEAGYRRGWTWNSIVLFKWIRDAYPERAKYLTVLFEHSAVVTFRNLESAGFPVSMVPTLGALGVLAEDGERRSDLARTSGSRFQSTRRDWEFYSIEGNVSKSRKSRG